MKKRIEHTFDALCEKCGGVCIGIPLRINAKRTLTDKEIKRLVKSTKKTEEYHPYQPKTGQVCGCRKGDQRDNCPDCEGTGMRIDFKAIRAQANQPTHSPIPWTVREAKDGSQWIEAKDEAVAHLDYQDLRRNRADAQFIRRAVNSHAELLEAIKGLLEFGIPSVEDGWKYQRISAVDKLRKAIAKAEGE